MRWILSLLLVVSVQAFAKEDAVPPVDSAKLEASAETKESVREENQSLTSAVTTGLDGAIAETRDESKILLNLENKKAASNEGSGMFRVLLTLSILGVVGTGAVFFLKKYKLPKALKHQTQIKVLQQHHLGPKKSLAIIRVAGESLLIGITDQNISMLKSLSLIDDEVPEEAPQSFGRVLGGLGSKSANDFDEADEAPEVRRPQRKSKELDSDEEFAISGIKDIVSKRLKGMRSFQ